MAQNVVPFGKYKGQPVEALAGDKDYVDWLLAQPWFKDKHQNIYTLIINNFTEPSETPEHNALQVLFLDNMFTEKVVTLHYAERVYEAVARSKRWNDGDREVDLKVSFEVSGADVYVRWRYCNVYSSVPRWLSIDNTEFAIEIKPSVGDDYPAILRQIRNISCPGTPILFIDRYVGVGATREQFIETFNRAGIKVVFRDEVADASDKMVVKEMCEKIVVARNVLWRSWSRQSLTQLDAELDCALAEQEVLFSEAVCEGDETQIRIHGEALVRGWQAAVRIMKDDDEARAVRLKLLRGQANA